MPTSRLRTCIEPALILLLCGAGIMALLTSMWPGADPTDRTVECALLMAVLAGPLIVWRLARRSTRTIIFITITVLLTGAGFSAIAWDLARTQIRDQAQTEFEKLTDRLRGDAERRINLPLYGPKGARGAYAASKLLDRAEFRAYVESRDLANEFPGVLGIGFIQRVMRHDLDAFVAAERADDAPEFTVRTTGDAADLFIVKFIDPLEQNRSAWGYDVGSEITRRIAIERAMRTGQPTLTACIRLVQDELDRAGFLYLVPIYRQGSKPMTAAEREEALVGLTYAALLTDDIFADAIKLADGRLDVEVHDEGSPAGSSLLFSAVEERASAPDDSPPGMFADVKYVHVGGRTWTMSFRTTAAFEQAPDRASPVITALLGLLVSAALATLVWSLARGRERALPLAQEMTKELRISEAHAHRARAEAERDERRFRTLVEGADVIVWEYDSALSAFTYVSPQAAKLGHPLERWLVPGFWHEALHPDDRDAAIAFCAAQVAAGSDHRFQYRMLRADGRSVWMDDFVSLERAPGSTPILRGVLVDITQRKQNEEALVQARVAADAANNSKSQFLANMSHEIRTPLTAILGYADLLRDDSTLDMEPQQRLQTIDTIRGAGQHLLTVINDILDLSKIEARLHDRGDDSDIDRRHPAGDRESHGSARRRQGRRAVVQAADTDTQQGDE
ncbi:MAG: CHASE domain-containing protein [Phycisphaerae bacterium]|nr:CHASE domain-containing protein [Phycisphaerae bacterium]